jgi:hypothetical protein
LEAIAGRLLESNSSVRFESMKRACSNQTAVDVRAWLVPNKRKALP